LIGKLIELNPLFKQWAPNYPNWSNFGYCLQFFARSLIEGEKLDPLHRDHQLTGDYTGRRKCHIEADWLLIHKLEKDWIVFERMGTHADLFE
jgi:mRNA interferase YafQ